MRTTQEIRDLLDELEHRTADDLEDQDLDFKEWNPRSTADSLELAIEMAVCMANSAPLPAFRELVEEEAEKGRALSVDWLLLLRHLTRESSVRIQDAASLCQRDPATARDVLHSMELRGYLKREGEAWVLAPPMVQRLLPQDNSERLLQLLSAAGRTGLSNAQLQAELGWDRHQVYRSMEGLIRQGRPIERRGQGRAARYYLQGDASPT